MKPYCEPRFLGALLLKTSRSEEADRLLKRFSPPYWVTALHLLQMDHLFAAAPQEERLKPVSGIAESRWRHDLAEGVFQIDDPNWDAAIRLARNAIPQLEPLVNSWVIYLHAALAATTQATHFCSFQPQYRQVARALGLRLLPEKLS